MTLGSVLGRIGEDGIAIEIAFDRTAFHAPDVTGVLGDGAVAGELAASGDVQHRFLIEEPAVMLVERTCLVVHLDVGGEVGKVVVAIALLEEGAADRFEDVRLVHVEVATEEQVHHLLDLLVGEDGGEGVVGRLQRRNLILGLAEDEEVLHPGLLCDLDVRPIHGTDGQCAVGHEFHVARPAEALPELISLLPEHGTEISALCHLEHHHGGEVNVNQCNMMGYFCKADALVPEGYDFYDVPTEHAAYAVYSSPDFDGNYFDAAYEFTRDQILGDNVHIPYPQAYWTAEVYLEAFFTGSGAHRFGYLFSVEL